MHVALELFAAHHRMLWTSKLLYAAQELSLHATTNTFEAWVDAKQRKAASEVAARHDEELQALRDKLDTHSVDCIARPRRYIVEYILTLKCPRCKAAFVDFESCLALKCRNCPCGFCACCMTDCGNDAHTHVRYSCAYAKASRPGGATSATEDDTNTAQNTWRLDAIRGYLAANVAADQHATVLQSLQREFADIDLDVSSLQTASATACSGAAASVKVCVRHKCCLQSIVCTIFG